MKKEHKNFSLRGNQSLSGKVSVLQTIPAVTTRVITWYYFMWHIYAYSVP